MAARTKRDWPYDQMQEWYEKDGLTMQQIGDRLGESAKLIWKIAKKKGWQTRRTGPKSGAGHPDWKGGRIVDKSGYVLLHIPEHPNSNSNGYVREHRVVMETVIGRLLTKDEVVHHKNDDKSDNRPENLHLFATNGEHLAETLAGKCPQWSEQGAANIRQVWAEMRRGGANYRKLRRARGDKELPPEPDRSTE